MLNAEKHRDQLLKFVEENHDSLFGIDKNSEPISCAVSRCNNCQFGFKKNNYIEGYSCSAAKMKWLLSEYKEPPIKLTGLEYLLLKLFYKKDFRYLTRGAGGYLYMHKGKNPPQKESGMWFNRNPYITFDVINDLFPFIKWEDEEPRAIKDILENCVVVEDESK